MAGIDQGRYTLKDVYVERRRMGTENRERPDLRWTVLKRLICSHALPRGHDKKMNLSGADDLTAAPAPTGLS